MSHFVKSAKNTKSTMKRCEEKLLNGKNLEWNFFGMEFLTQSMKKLQNI